MLKRLVLREELRNSASNVLKYVAILSRVKKQLFGIQEGSKTFNKLAKEQNDVSIKLKSAMNQYKIITRRYRSETDDNISEEMNRQFELIRSDFKDLYLKQRALVKGNVMIMRRLGIHPEEPKSEQKSEDKETKDLQNSREKRKEKTDMATSIENVAREKV